MTQELLDKCTLFVNNRNVIKKNFAWDHSSLFPICASMYTQKGKNVDPDRIKACKQMIKKKTGMFSNFRGVAMLAIATMLSLMDNPEQEFDKVLRVYGILKKSFTGSAYLPLTATVIATMVDELEYERTAQKAHDIYKLMKKEHPMLTSSEDSGMIALLAMSDLSVQQITTEIERCYQILKPEFFSKNAVQALSLTLAIGEQSAQEKCARSVQLFNQLKEEKCKYGTGMELATLGVLVLSDINPESVVSNIKEINEVLLHAGGFGAMGTGKAHRIMYASILAVDDYQKDSSKDSMNVAAINSITSMIIAQQVAICSAVACSAAASSASS